MGLLKTHPSRKICSWYPAVCSNHMFVAYCLNAFLLCFRVWVQKSSEYLLSYVYRMPHTTQDHKIRAYILPFSKCPEDIFVLFNMLQCIGILTIQNWLYSGIRRNTATPCYHWVLLRIWVHQLWRHSCVPSSSELKQVSWRAWCWMNMRAWGITIL